MINQLIQSEIKKIYEAHTLIMNLRRAAEYAGVSHETVRNYWKKRGLETHFERVGQNKLTQTKIAKVYKAHELMMSISKSAEYARVGHGTISKYWKKRGLEVHFKRGRPPITKKQMDRIYEAYRLEMSTRKAAEYAKVSRQTILNYWNIKELETPFNRDLRVE